MTIHQAGTWALGAAPPSVEILNDEIVRLRRAADRGSKCVVADNQQTMRLLLGQALKQAGFAAPFPAADSTTAMNLIQDHDCDLVIVDFNLPPMGGLELLDRVRHNPARAGMVFVMVSADSLDAALMRAAEEPWDAYLTKPVSPQRLARRLNLIIERRLTTARALRMEVSGERDRAVDTLLGAVNDYPDYTWPLFALGQVLSRAERDEEAQRCFERALALNPQAVSALVAMGRMAERQGDPSHARALYRQALAANPMFFRAYDVLAESLVMAGRLGEAQEVLADAVRRQGGQNAARQERLGALRMQDKRFQQAEEAFVRALELRPTRNQAANNFNLGKARLAQGHHKEAAEAFRRAAEASLAEGDGQIRKDALLLWGTTHLREGRPDLAEQVWASMADPAGWPKGRPPVDLGELYRQTGALFLREGHRDSAGRSFMLSLRLGGGGEEGLRAVQDLCRKAGREELAQRAGQAIGRHEPGRLERLVAEAIALVGRSRYEQAEALYKQALEMAPDAGRVHYNLGKLYLRMERPKQAASQLDLAGRWGLAAGDRDLVMELIKVHRKLGRIAEARWLALELSERRPQDQQVAEVLAQLGRLPAEYL